MNDVIDRAVAGIVADKDLAAFDRQTAEMELQLGACRTPLEYAKAALRVAVRRSGVRPVLIALRDAVMDDFHAITPGAIAEGKRKMEWSRRYIDPSVVVEDSGKVSVEDRGPLLVSEWRAALKGEATP